MRVAGGGRATPEHLTSAATSQTVKMPRPSSWDAGAGGRAGGRTGAGERATLCIATSKNLKMLVHHLRILGQVAGGRAGVWNAVCRILDVSYCGI